MVNNLSDIIRSENIFLTEEELFNLRFQAKMGQLSNPLRLRIVRHDIARVKTLISEKTSAARASSAEEPKQS